MTHTGQTIVDTTAHVIGQVYRFIAFVWPLLSGVEGFIPACTFVAAMFVCVVVIKARQGLLNLVKHPVQMARRLFPLRRFPAWGLAGLLMLVGTGFLNKLMIGDPNYTWRQSTNNVARSVWAPHTLGDPHAKPRSGYLIDTGVKEYDRRMNEATDPKKHKFAPVIPN